MFFSDELSNDRRAALEDHRFSFNCGRPVRTTGHVVSAKDKTIAVLVERTIRHKKYGKVIKKRRKYQVHDESNISRIGDLVDFVECRPISKTKSHKLLYIISR
ncbi:30S ribosomal protein S17 [bacterium]|nr:MAG: 30S ribosomal protein S17 [bacterium]